jgi:hypothetical protein
MPDFVSFGEYVISAVVERSSLVPERPSVRGTDSVDTPNNIGIVRNNLIRSNTNYMTFKPEQSALVFRLAQTVVEYDHIVHRLGTSRHVAPHERTISLARSWKMKQVRDRERVADASRKRRDKQERGLGNRQESRKALSQCPRWAGRTRSHGDQRRQKQRGG